MNAMLTVENLSVTFATVAGDVKAVRGVNLELRAGETVGVVGESGSGKSTLARAITGLVTPSTGRITVEGRPVQPVKGRRSSADAEAVQMIFQDPYSSLNPRQRAVAAVAEAVHVGRRMRMREAVPRALELLASVGISGSQAEMKVRSLSGGQRQRVSIARALAVEPKILVADEPTSALDQSIAASLINLLRKIQKEREIGIVFISHDLSVVGYLADRVFVMKSGAVVESGSTHRVFSSPQHDYTKTLIAAIPGARRASIA